MLAYFDCFSGISGDMTLGALIDLGVPVDWLQSSLAALPLEGFSIAADSTERHGISARQVSVHVSSDPPHRHYRDIREMVKGSQLNVRVKQLSLDMFGCIAEAEARIHGVETDDVHFHEVGAVDAIVDIVGTALGIDYLGITDVMASPLPMGTGVVECAHGRLPVPAPATLEILKGVPVYGGDFQSEMVTPTGAAIVQTLAASFDAMPEMVIDQIGYGAGSRVSDTIPNLLRVVLGVESSAAGSRQRVTVLECAVDDMNPEWLGYAMERLFAEGAMDVYWTPVYMKKNRPGTHVTVICPPDAQDVVARCLLSETTSIGLRVSSVDRVVLEREAATIDTPYGPTTVKQIVDPHGHQRLVPEYEACRRIARDRGLPLREVYATILATALKD